MALNNKIMRSTCQDAVRTGFSADLPHVEWWFPFRSLAGKERPRSNPQPDDEEGAGGGSCPTPCPRGLPARVALDVSVFHYFWLLPFTTYYWYSHLSLPLLFSSTCVFSTALPASGLQVRYFVTPPAQNDHLFPKRVRIDPIMPLVLALRQHHPCLASPVLRNHEAQMGHLLLSSPQTHPKH